MASIGSIFIDFVVRTEQLQNGMEDAIERVVGGTGEMVTGFGAVSGASDAMATAVERGGLRVGASFLGARSITMALVNDIKDVYKNIDSIPGISPEVLESIRQMKYEFEGSGSVLKAATAQLESWFAEAGTGIGLGLGALVSGSLSDAQEAAAQLSKEADDFASNEHIEKMDAIKKKIDDIGKSSGTLAAELLKASNAQSDLAISGASSPAAAWKAAETSGEDYYEALVKINNEQNEYRKLMEQAGNTEDKFDIKNMDAAQAVETLRQKLRELHDDQNNIVGDSFEQFFGDPQKLERFNADEEQVIQTTKLLNQEITKMKQPTIELDKTFENAFESSANILAQFITTGKAKFADFFQSIIEQILTTLIKLELINPMINQIFKGAAGFQSLPAFSSGASLIGTIAGFLADGGTADQGKPYVVGEEGPELFVPGSTGTVIPNGTKLSGQASGAGLVVNYNIASGVTHNELAPILELHSQKIKREIYGARQRGGTPARAFG